MKVTYKKYKDLFKTYPDVKIIKHSIFVERLFKLDQKVNNLLTNKSYSNSSWSITKLEIDNFLSYGSNNVIEFDKLNGLTLVPGQNKIGKTCFCVDAILFLLFNTTTKTTKSEEIFNTYSSEDICRVKGWLNINNQKFIIERQIIRKWKKDRTPNCSTELNFYKELNDGTIENLEGEQRQETDKIIKEIIGSEEDFLMSVLITGDSLMDVIELKPTARGQLLNRYLGLNVFEEKEKICKEIYSNWKTTLKSNLYDISILNDEIYKLQEEIKQKEKELKENKEKLSIIEKTIKDTKEIKDSLLSSLHQDIDEQLSKSDPLTIEKKIKDLEKENDDKKNNLEEIKKQINKIQVVYKKEEHEKIIQKERELSPNIKILKNNIERIEKDVKELKEGEVCSKCGQSLKNVDHSKEIKELSIQLELNNSMYEKYNKELSELEQQIKSYQEIKNKIEQRDKLSLTNDRTEIEIESLSIKLQKQNDILKDYHKNIDNINQNNKINDKIRDINFKLHQQETEEKDLVSKLKDIDYSVRNNEKQIEEKILISKEIKKEQEIQKIFITYLSLVGKNGISKSILQNYIPQINQELEKLLSDTVNFTPMIEMNLNNTELMLLLKDENGIIRQLKSGSGFERTICALSIRTILGKINSLSKPDILILDEVLGKVSEENLMMMGEFFQKLRTMFSSILLITHNEKLKDISDNILSIEMVNNISKISQN